MNSPLVFGNPVMFGAMDWNYAAGAPVRRGKSVEELGDAGWARERERMAHLQQLQHLHQLQLQQQQVGYAAYGILAPGQPQGPVMIASPHSGPVPPPGCPMPVHASLMSVHSGPMVAVAGPVPPPVHVPAPWPVQWENQAQIRQGNQPSWEYEDRHNADLKNNGDQGHNLYFHPRSEDGHLNVRRSEWKGKHCFYQGPEDYSHQDYNRAPQERDGDLRGQEKYGTVDDDRKKRDHDCDADRYGRNSHRDLEQSDHKDKYAHRDHYDRKYNDHYDRREQQYDNRTRHKYDLREHDSYNSEYEDYYDHKDKYAHSEDYYDHRDSDHQYDHRDREYYDSKENNRYREYYAEQKSRDRYYDRRADDQYDSRENVQRDRDVYDRRSEETYTNKGRAQRDLGPDEHYGSKEKDHYYRYRDTSDDRKDERYNHSRRVDCKAKENYERRAADHHYSENEDGYNNIDADPHELREGGRSRYKLRGRYRDLRSASVDKQYEEYPTKNCKTHCEEWVERQNQKLALREMRSYEDPVTYSHSDDQERGYESSTGIAGPRRGHKPVYVGSLDRNSFYRKTAPSSLRTTQFATNRKQNQGKHQDTVLLEKVQRVPFLSMSYHRLCNQF